ncbi:MAG: hypothetical protein IKW87_12820 [Ruminococcus sp.]|nr:hypothetical protein [Ruminococcus sp.]
MNIYTVSFFGHREIRDMNVVENTLMPILHDLITTKEYVEFLVGRDGDFDRIVSSTIRTTVRQYGCGNTSHILVLPYERADYRDNKAEYESYYDEVQICPESAEAHPKAAISIRNRAMIDKSNLVVCYIEHNSGGAFKAIKYAEKLGKKVVRLK